MSRTRSIAQQIQDLTGEHNQKKYEALRAALNAEAGVTTEARLSDSIIQIHDWSLVEVSLEFPLTADRFTFTWNGSSTLNLRAFGGRRYTRSAGAGQELTSEPFSLERYAVMIELLNDWHEELINLGLPDQEWAA